MISLYTSFLELERPLLDVDDMSDEELQEYLGQLFLVGFEVEWDKSFEDCVVHSLIDDFGVGGVILFRRNFPYYYYDAVPVDIKRQELMEHIRKLQDWSHRASKLPLFVAVDQEGGNASQLCNGLMTELPSNMALGSLRDEDDAYTAGRITGEELCMLNFNMNLAPVADVNTNGRNDLIRDRSFGGHQDLVAPMARAYFEGQRDAGIISVAKHYPGHGSTEEGIEAPGVPKSSLSPENIISSIDPFRELVDHGIECLMSSHFTLSFSSSDIVTYDENFISRGLRTDSIEVFDDTWLKPLNFPGVIMTDDLCLPCITARDTSANGDVYADRVAEAAVKAFDAGHDILMVAHIFPNHSTDAVLNKPNWSYRKALRLSEFGRVYQLLRDHIFSADAGVRKERIDRFKQSLIRILHLKDKISNKTTREYTSDYFDNIVEKCHHRKLSDDFFRKSFGMVPAIGGFPELSRFDKSDTIVVYFPANIVNYQGLRRIETGPDYIEFLEERINSVPFARELNEVFRDRTSMVMRMELEYPAPVAYKSRAMTIAHSAESLKPSAMVFIISNANQWELFNYSLRQLDRSTDFDLSNVVVILTSSPTLLNLQPLKETPELVTRINILVAYSGFEKNAEILCRYLADNQAVRGSELPVSIASINPTPRWKVKPRDEASNPYLESNLADVSH
ncbi:MAG: hypothetical protein KKG33_10530 [candidate division Zixibacteria bacterium]|nr:hypothetical protein [candidate division Zixibacteria bacterium]MBU1469285.1 hypothetical protein [candidate division Zixibacteria bacterium]MBU2625982.1 hypothetical protein [candidate division Zixibacteria bacterium]